jgi:hypothetical protein
LREPLENVSRGYPIGAILTSNRSEGVASLQANEKRLWYWLATMGQKNNYY